MSKGKFIESTVYGPDGNPIVGAGVQEKELTEAIENSYFFGQFMAYYFAICLVEQVGTEAAIKFMTKKVNDIAQGNPMFVVKAEELEKSLMQYYRDSMEGKDTHIKQEKQHAGG